MADGADATDTGRNGGHFPKRSSLTKLLKPSKLGDMKSGVAHFALVIKVDGDFGVTLNTGNRVNNNSVRHDRDVGKMT